MRGDRHHERQDKRERDGQEHSCIGSFWSDDGCGGIGGGLAVLATVAVVLGDSGYRTRGPVPKDGEEANVESL